MEFFPSVIPDKRKLVRIKRAYRAAKATFIFLVQTEVLDEEQQDEKCE
jgi:hypothetical protein